MHYIKNIIRNNSNILLINKQTRKEKLLLWSWRETKLRPESFISSTTVVKNHGEEFFSFFFLQRSQDNRGKFL